MVGLLTAFFAQGAALPPPHPNPHDGGSHWYHGTGIDEHSFDEDEDQDPETRMPGGSLRSPDTWEAEYGQNASKHWNTGLGVHFTSRHHVARGFATNDGGHETKAHQGARVAHAMLHMANPKHYDSEYDMAKDAAGWAVRNGHHYVDPDTRNEHEEHVFHGDPISELPDHEHLGYVDDATDAGERQMIHNIDSGGESMHGRDYDKYLNLHPDRPEIQEGFKKHLQDQGHDGVTYGNEYEAPIGHRCAIPLDDSQIHIRHWQWLHPSEQHRNRSAEGEEPPTQPEHLVQRDYTPEHGHHWVGPDGKKLGAKAPQKPEWDTEQDYDTNRGAHNTWQAGIRRGLSLGQHTNQEAREAGYSGVGHDQHENGYEPHYGLKWEPLPKTVYHVTTHRDDVLAHGLKSRDELGQSKGKGLGGGESDTISFTEDPDTAHHIHRSLHEYHSMLQKPLGEATKQMMDEAEAGGYAHQIHSVEGSDTIARRLKGHVSIHDSEMTHIPIHQKFMTEAEAKERIHPGAELDPERTVHMPGEEPRSMAITRPATEEEAREQISAHYKAHTWMRSHNGGPMDPLFSQNDVHGFAKMDPSQFAVIKARAKPGAQGYKMGSLGEWRTATGDAVEGEHVDEALHHQGALYHVAPASARASIEEHGIDHTRGQSPWADAPVGFRSQDFPAGNYLWESREDAERYHHGPSDIWEVNAEGHQADPMGTPGARVSHDPIPASSIARVAGHTGAREDLSWSDVIAHHPLYGEYGFDHAVNELASSHPGFEGEMTTPRLRFTEEEVHPSQVKFQRYPADDERVGRIAEGGSIPPVLLVRRAGELHTADGHHRLSEAEMRGSSVPAVIAHSPREDKYQGRASLGVVAGLNGDLPEGIHFEHSVHPDHHLIVASDPLGATLGELSWYHDKNRAGMTPGRIHTVDVSRFQQRKGIATEMLRRAREIDPSVHHSTSLSQDAQGWIKSLASLLPGYEHEHEWLPDHGIFSRTKAELDPVLFGRRGKMRQCVKKVVFARMDAAVHEVYPDWRDWTRSYFAGGEASLWWGNHDLDVLVGIDYDKFRKAHPEDAALTNEEISAKITRLWRLGYNSETWTAPWDGEEWHVTAFSNPESWDIRDIKPYAAYLMDTDTWVVKPPKVDSTWGPGSFPESDWNMGEGYLKAIDAVDRIEDPIQRCREGAALYTYLHDHRRDAFGAHGTGWDDPANVVWKFLEYHPSAPVEKLVGWAHQWNEAKAAA